MTAWNATNARGAPVQSSDFTFPVMLVDFWETTCTACVEELQDLVRLQRALGPRGFSIVGLSIDLNPQDVLHFLDVHDDIAYPMMMNSASASTAFLGGAIGVPTKYLVDQERKIVGRFLGGYVPVNETFNYYMGQIGPLLRSSSIMQLQITRQTNSARISWPDSDLSYRLESSLNPLSGWAPTDGPAQTNGGRKTVTLPMEGSGRFFRLMKP
jgi:thiol-disulfide isomerase/thioredoxin